METQLTLNRTFEEEGELAVNSEKEGNFMSIQRKIQIVCQFKAIVNQPPVIIHQTSVSQKKKKKGEGLGC